MSADEFSIRELDQSDITEILELWRQAHLEHKPQGRDRAEEMARQMADDHLAFIGAFDGRRMVATVLVNWEGRKGWINRLAVHPQYRHKGLGLRMIAEGERALRDMGARIICCLIEDWNEASLALFCEAGYELHKDVYYLTKRDDEEV